MDNNAYFEQVREFFASKSENELADGISRVQLIVSKIEDDPVWRNLMVDIGLKMKHVDSLWQDTYKEETLEQIRVLKKAYSLLISLPEQYRQELEFMKKELTDRDTTNHISRDVDNETREE